MATVVVAFAAAVALTQLRHRRTIGELRLRLALQEDSLQRVFWAEATLDWLLRDQVTDDPAWFIRHLEREVAGYVLHYFEVGDDYDRLLNDPDHTADFVTEALGMMDCTEATDLRTRCQTTYSMFPDDELHGWALEIETSRLKELQVFFDRCMRSKVESEPADG